MENPTPRPASPAGHAIGWREWLALPELGVPAIKAKVDTGARTSALHAEQIEVFEHLGQCRVRFVIYPIRKRRNIAVNAELPVADVRVVTDSSGHRTRRVFVRTVVQAGSLRWPIELNLSDRGTMLFPMLLGRAAVAGHLLIDPARAYTLGRPSRHLRVEYPQAGGPIR